MYLKMIGKPRNYGDTIDYMKELLERIGKLQEERNEEDINQINLMGKSKEMKPNEATVRNIPKFEVEKGDQDTKVSSICCCTRAGLLLSTVNTLEALGLEIQQCVVSSFNDFLMQAFMLKVFGVRVENWYYIRRDKASTIQECRLRWKMSIGPR